MASLEPGLVLYSYFRSSCSARVRIALNLKSLPYTYKPIDLLKGEQSSSTYRALNPSRFVPTLVDSGGPPVVQSVAILEYLEEKYPTAYPLLPPPEDAAGRAAIRALVSIIASDTQPVTNLRILSRIEGLGGDKVAYAKELITEGLAAYEALASRTAGRYSYGDSVTLADACLIPAVWGAARFGVQVDQFQTVKRIFDAVSALEAVQKAHWKNQEDTPPELRE